MTAPAEIIVPIPAPLEHQVADIQHPARFKVLRKGRRWGKDRLAFHVAWFGHGPLTGDTPVWAGILDGWDVAWLAPDFKQGRGIWAEEIMTGRFNDVPGVTVNQQDRTVVLEGCGGLYFYSGENVDAMRGLGKRLKGVIINEAAHLDLSYAWRTVIRPILADNRGWALIMSTTNSGTDGGLDEQLNRRVPSYFNTLCDEIRTGVRGSDWLETTGTAEENPKIGPVEFAGLVSEYAVGSVALDQEIYAKLLAPGMGLAFPEWRDADHTLERFTIPAHWEYGGGFDWGYWQPSAFTLFAVGEESQTVGVKELRWVQKSGQEMGRDLGTLAASLDRPLRSIAADSSMWGVESKKGFPNQAEEIQNGIREAWETAGKPKGQEPWLMAVPKSGDSRRMRASLLHKYLRVPEGQAPRLRFLKSCTHSISTIPKLPPDPKDPEDVETLRSEDHFYDADTYFLMSRPPLVDAPLNERVIPDVHPGLEARYARKLAAMGLIKSEKPTKHARYKPTGPMTRLP